MSCAKTADRSREYLVCGLSFPMNHELNGVQIPKWEGALLGDFPPTESLQLLAAHYAAATAIIHL